MRRITKRITKQKFLTGLLLLSYIGMMALANGVTPDRDFSDSENRVLGQRPGFSLHSFLNGQFISDYERYTSDQFVFRDAWIRMKTDVDRALGKRESNGVFLGKDGYLFKQYTSPSAADLENRAQAIQMLDQATPGLNKYVMLAPTAVALLSVKLPAHAPVGDERADLERIRQLLPQDIRFVDIYPALYAQREQPIFYRTDHHWTTEGAYYAYRELGSQMGIVPQSTDAFDIHQASDEFYGTLYSTSGFRHLQPDRIHLYLPKKKSSIKVSYVNEGLVSDSMYELDHLRKKDKYAIFLNGNHALIRIVTDNPTDKKLLVIKDSYANSLVPFLTEHFGEIDIVDLRYYDESVLRLVHERQYQDMLILYNVTTFFEDPSILNLMEEIP
ncbi:DHHW family protein [Paenibacillus sp. FSL K6-1230]|uniref:DHHW family protein n=1 Tax=Paenibacillus sp. FSL K6-1230 TaxID=2921603 RepID=UPI0030FB8B9B